MSVPAINVLSKNEKKYSSKMGKSIRHMRVKLADLQVIVLTYDRKAVIPNGAEE